RACTRITSTGPCEVTVTRARACGMQPAVTAPVDRSIRNWMCLLAAAPLPASDAAMTIATTMPPRPSPTTRRALRLSTMYPPERRDVSASGDGQPRRPIRPKMCADGPWRAGTIATHPADHAGPRIRTPAVRPGTSECLTLCDGVQAAGARPCPTVYLIPQEVSRSPAWVPDG